MTLDVLQPKLSGRGLHERGPCSLRFRGHFLVFFSAPDAGCDHSSVRRVIAHAHWACTAHGGYLCERVAVGPDEPPGKCHEFGENKEFERQYLAGELALEFTPQGTLAEKLRAGGAGIPAFFTKTGVGTMVADGKELREFDGEMYVMERSLVPDIALVKADVADKSGNLRFRLTARNFNPAAAMAGKLCIVEVEKIVEVGELAPDDIHLPGIYVHRIVLNATPEKRIEKRTVTVPANNPAGA